MNETIANVVFYLRQVNAVELFIIALCLIYLRTIFKNRFVRQALFYATLWCILYATCRIFTPWIDYYTNQGYGIASLVTNIVFFGAPCAVLLRFIRLVKTQRLSLASISARTDSAFDEMFSELHDQIRRTDEFAERIREDSSKN